MSRSAMKTVMVTGSAGFAGAHFVEHILKNTDWNVIGLDSFRHRGDALRIYGDPKRYSIHTCDLSVPISDRLLKSLGRIDYIVNMASESHVDRSITDPVPFVQNNVNLVLSLLEAARKLSPEIFVQISTDEVYGPARDGVNHSEWSPIIPSNPYSASKAAQEAIAISYWRTYQTPLIITNCMNMFGERQDTEKYIPYLVRSIQNGEEVSVHGSQDYIGRRHYMHARNHADALLFLLKKGAPTMYPLTGLDSNVLPDRYNIVGEVEIDNLELAHTVAKILKKPLRHKFVDFHSARPGHDRRYALTGDKLKTAGWKPRVPFMSSLEKTIRWTLEHPEWLL
jgi:dTDP-glucose 4,6-dehydratase